MDICISSWSFHPAFENGLLNTLDFPAFCKDEFGVKKIEFYDPDFFYGPEGMPKGKGALPADDAYLEQVKKACKDAGVSIVAIAAQNDFTDPNEKARQADIERVRAWMDIAPSVGAKIIRINSGIWLTSPDGVRRLRLALEDLGRKAKREGLVLALENHPKNLRQVGQAEVMTHIAIDLEDKGVATCPDNGHIAKEVRFDCLDVLFTTAKHCHVKFYEFDEAGNETTIDYEKFFQVARCNKYDGALSIELLPPSGTDVSLICSKVTQRTVDELRDRGVPTEAVEKLASLRGNVYCSKRELDDALGQALSREELSKYRPILLQLMERQDLDFVQRKDLARKAVSLLLRHGAVQ